MPADVRFLSANVQIVSRVKQTTHGGIFMTSMENYNFQLDFCTWKHKVGVGIVFPK